ncbi:MAG: hypothetical protein AAF918_01660 [Pseudomonadota bacterium]
MSASPVALPSWRRQFLVLLVAVLCAAVAVLRLPLTYDLTWFLPTAETTAEAVLTERVGQGPGAELLFLRLPVVEGAPIDDGRRAQLVQALQALPGVEQVVSSMVPSDASSLAALPAQLSAQLLQRRWLLYDLPTRTEDWAALLAERAYDVQSAFDDEFMFAVAEDPSLGLLTLADRLRAARSSAVDDRTLLLLTAVPAFDLDAQTALVQAVTAASQSVYGTAEGVELFGAGAYGVALNGQIRRESIVFSVLASMALLTLVVLRFRSPRVVLTIALPLAAGAGAGAVALAALFPQVHGITLAFGFTILGVVVDYPLHLASHPAPRQVWPTLRIGVLSTVVAYLSFQFSGVDGIRQLGTFAVAGLLGAALASWILFRQPSHRADPGAEGQRAREPVGRLRHLPWLLALVLSATTLTLAGRLNPDLGAMTPIPERWRTAEATLREQFATLEQRYLVALAGRTEAEALVATDAATGLLDEAIRARLLADYQPVTLLLPPPDRQRARRDAIAQGAVAASFERALADSAFTAEAFDPFRQRLQAIADTPQSLPLLTSAELRQAGALRRLIDAQLYPVDGGYRSIIFLRGVEDAGALSAFMDARKNEEPHLAGLQVVDLKQTSVGLVQRYQARFVMVLGSVTLALPVLLWLALGTLPRALWCAGTLTAAVLTAAVLMSVLHGALSLFELIALLLVAGLGLDYALFFSRIAAAPLDVEERRRVTGAVTLCAASSLLVFGVLSLSSIPLLEGLGRTVSAGVLLAYLLARFGVATRKP